MTRPVLLLSSSPLHSLWALALARGAFAGTPCVLWAMDWHESRVDPIVAALRDGGPQPFAALATLPPLRRRTAGSMPALRAQLRDYQARVRALDPLRIVTGNDARHDFHAAIAAAPAAIGGYLDDGSASYYEAVAPRLPKLDAWRRRLSGWRRRYKYGFPDEKPAQLGSSRAVREAWVALPAQVHAGLARKTVHAIEPAWLRDAQLAAVCETALHGCGLAPDRLCGLDLLLALPRESEFERMPALRGRLQDLVQETLATGGRLAVKSHPRSASCGLSLPRDGSCVEIPKRLPLELLAPLLSGTRVVGSFTSALIYLRWLGADVRVEALVPPVLRHHPVARLYERLGIPPLTD